MIQNLEIGLLLMNDFELEVNWSYQTERELELKGRFFLLLINYK